MKKQVLAFVISLFVFFYISPLLVFGQPINDSISPTVGSTTDDESSINIEVLDPTENSDNAQYSENADNSQKNNSEAKLPIPDINADGAIVIEQSTGKILYEKNMHKKLCPASTTKILTALLAIELGDLDEIVTVGEEINMVPWDSSKAGLIEGEKISLKDLIYGLLINSGNDAANAIAVHIARTESANNNMSTQEALDYFIDLMNKRAKEAGALNSNFVNAHGYHDPNHYTTAYDLAMIGRDAMKYEFFREATSTHLMENGCWEDGSPRFWTNKNRLIDKNSPDYYQYAVGGKTGYTSNAGQCLISMATKDNMDLITVVFKCDTNQQWSDTRNLFEYAFSNYKPYKLFEKGTIVETFPVDKYASDDWGSLAVQIEADDFIDILHVDDIPKLEKAITWNTKLFTNQESDLPRLSAPIKKDQKIGEFTVSLNNQILAKSNITAVRDVKERTLLDLPQTIKSEGINWPVLVIFIILALMALKTIVFIVNKKRRRAKYTYHSKY